MLDGPFAEGQPQRSAVSPQELVLHDDDSSAVCDICGLLYHKVKRLTRDPLSAAALYYLIKAADKYDCLSTMRLQILGLMHTRFDCYTEHNWKDSVLHAAAAYLFKDAKFFETATRHLIMNFNEPLSGVRKLDGGEVLPVSALLAMAERRAKAQRTISVNLTEYHVDFLCGCLVSRSSDYMSSLQDALRLSSWPPSFNAKHDTIESITATLKSIKLLSGYFANDCDPDGVGRVNVVEQVEGIEAMCRGLCIECVREDSGEVAGSTCRHRS